MVPFVKAAPDYCIYECQHGPDHDSNRKRKRRLKNNSDGRVSFAITKKVGCPARIVLEEHIRAVEQKLIFSDLFPVIHLPRLYCE